MILVTGAAGHIGNVLVRELLQRGERVRAMLMPGEDRTPLCDLNAELIEADVLDYSSLQAAFEDVQVVYHLAGLISILPGENRLMQLVNVHGTRNVLHAARAAGVKRLVYTSSIHALQRIPPGATIDESLPFDPQDALGSYDRTKARASIEVQQAIRDGLDAVIVCPTGVIGPYDFRRSEMGQFILDVIDRRPMLFVDGAYDFVDVRDVVQGHILACERGSTGESYILSGERITIPSLLSALRLITGRAVPKIKIPTPLAQLAARLTPFYYRWSKTRPRFTTYSLATLNSNSDISHAKARRLLGYSPRPLYESLADAVRWFIENRPLLSNHI